MILRLLVLLLMLPSLVLGPSLRAQQPSGMPLAAPALPSVLPGGAAVPNLPPGTQQEILQRLLDAGASRGPGAVAPAMPQAPGGMPPGWGATPQGRGPIPQPPPSQAPTGPAPGEEPFSPVEQFFAARMTVPLRQFGYESFRSETAYFNCLSSKRLKNQQPTQQQAL